MDGKLGREEKWRRKGSGMGKKREGKQPPLCSRLTIFSSLPLSSPSPPSLPSFLLSPQFPLRPTIRPWVSKDDAALRAYVLSRVAFLFLTAFLRGSLSVTWIKRCTFRWMVCRVTSANDGSSLDISPYKPLIIAITCEQHATADLSHSTQQNDYCTPSGSCSSSRVIRQYWLTKQ